MDRLLWGDFETTTFDPKVGLFLEAGFSVTDERLNEVASFRAVVHHPDEALDDLRAWHPKARVFHEANGLIGEVRTSRATLADVDAALEAWIRLHASRPGDAEDRLAGLYLAGSGVDFERRWFPVSLPRSCALVSRRNFDVNTLLAFFGADDLLEGMKDESVKAHRALEDVRRDQAITRILAGRAGLKLA